MLIATKPRHQALSNAAENLKLEILGNELDVIRKARYLNFQVDNRSDWKEKNYNNVFQGFESHWFS